jgi:type IV secretion system protein VirB5
MRKLIQILALVTALFGGTPARAGVPVIDVANLANSLQQVLAWAEQYQQMYQQYQQLVQQYNQAVSTFNSLNGIRGMADLVNNPALRKYLPNEWGQTMDLINNPNGYSNLQSSVNSLKAGMKVWGLDQTNLNANSSAGRAFVGSQNQVAMNRALGEEGYKQASERITAIQTLVDKVNAAPEQKDVLDLQARIQAEQAMVQNENVKLALLSQLQQAQRDLQAQQAREISMQSTKSAAGVIRF